MKKILIYALFLITPLFAKQYMVQIEPFEKYEIKSQTSGLVNFVNKEFESKYIQESELLIKLNDTDEKIELSKQKNSLKVQEEIVKIKKQNFGSKNRVLGMSRYEKQREKLDFLESKKELVLLKEQIKALNNEISKKTIKIENRYISKLYVKKDEYVSVGDKLYDSYDISKQKITLYLSKEEIENLNNNKLYINGTASDFKLHRVQKIKDEIKISRYEVQFIKENKKLDEFFFNEIVKVELRK